MSKTTDSIAKTRKARHKRGINPGFKQALEDVFIAAGKDGTDIDAAIRHAAEKGEKTETLSEKTLANELDGLLGGVFVYALKHQGGCWLSREDDGLWQIDDRGAALRKIIRVEMDRAPKMQRGSAVSGVEILMRYGVLTDFEDGWDGLPELAGLPDGRVLNLKSGKTRAGSRYDRITKRLGVVPESGTPKRWLEFLNESLPVDGLKENVAFLKRWCGYTLTGHNREHKFLLLLGSGGNGKSTFLNVLETILGSYLRRLAERIFVWQHARSPSMAGTNCQCTVRGYR